MEKNPHVGITQTAPRLVFGERSTPTPVDERV